MPTDASRPAAGASANRPVDRPAGPPAGPLATPPTGTPAPAPHARHRLWRGLLIGGLGTAMAAIGLGVAVLAWYGPQLPSLAPVTTYQPRQPLQVFTADGVEIAQFGSERRQFVAIDQIPLLMQQAVLAVEDARFYQHRGIDLKGLARAVGAQLTGGLRQGASTITQQVARTFFLSQRFTPERKIKEALLALEIERQLSKPQILELYMNQIYLGTRSYGFAAAADAYFGKPLAALSLAEAAMLAGLPQNPSFANPLVNLERATQRQRIVLARMVTTGAITPQQQAAARAEVLTLRSPGSQVLHAEHVAEMARRLVVERFGTDAYSQGLRVTTTLRAADQQAAWSAVRKGVLAYDARQAWRGPEGFEALPAGNSNDLEATAALALKDYRDDEDLRVAIVLQAGPKEVLAQLASGERVTVRGDGLRVAQPGLAARAPPDLVLRRGAVLRVAQLRGRGAAAAGAGAGGAATAATTTSPAINPAATPATWAVVQWPEVQAGLVALDPVNGQVRALVGGFDFTRQPFNHVTQAQRQPGSSFKPFLYSAALEQGVMPETLVDDAPLMGDDGQPGLNGWNPRTSDDKFDGEISVREGLVRSKNLVSIRLLQHIGLPAARQWLTRFGFELDRHPGNLTLALGSGSVTPLQMAQAYAVFANGGHRVTPVLIEKIVDAQGRVIFEAPPPAPLDENTRVLPARNVFIVNTLMRDVTARGTAARAQGALGRSDVYGKTGTTNDAVDAWFTGWAPGVAAVAWIGHDEPRSLGERESGGGLALPVWIDVMARALRGVPFEPLQRPAGVVSVGEDWRYAEFAEGGFVQRIEGAGSNPLAPQLPASAAANGPAAPAASAAASAPAPALAPAPAR